MKWLVLIILFFSIKGYSQKQVSEFKKMIDSAINIKAQNFSDEKNLYLLDENSFPYTYTGVATKLKFKAINLSNVKSKSVLKKGIQAWKIIPVLKGNRITVNIIDYFITYKDRNYNYANGGGAEIIFDYLCSENKWVLVKSKNQGL